jgi:transcription initiation factor TFIIIB Brf1 subunit/transcription initiation factor TFIIB
MPTCPNCGYELVLFSNRLKYKCALCSKLFSQRAIDNKTFKIWNKKQRENDLHNLKLEDKQGRELIRDIRILRGFRLLFKDERVKLSKEEKLQRKRDYYQKNKETLNLKRREFGRINLKSENIRKKEWRNKKLEEMRVYGLIQHYRSKQKALALQYLKNK